MRRGQVAATVAMCGAGVALAVAGGVLHSVILAVCAMILVVGAVARAWIP